MRHADNGRSTSPRTMRNRACLYETAMDPSLSSAKLVENDLRAPSRKTHDLAYHPIVNNMRENPSLGSSVFCRWNHPLRGEIHLPNAFRSPELGPHHRARRMGPAPRLPDAGVPRNMVAATSHRFSSAALFVLRRRAAFPLAETGFDPMRLELEVTKAPFSACRTAELAFPAEGHCRSWRLMISAPDVEPASICCRFPFTSSDRSGFVLSIEKSARRVRHRAPRSDRLPRSLHEGHRRRLETAEQHCSCAPPRGRRHSSCRAYRFGRPAPPPTSPPASRRLARSASPTTARPIAMAG